MSAALLEAVSKWRQEAAKEDAKYLYERKDFAQLLTGERYIVSGRKGAGKTATLGYIDRACKKEQIAHRHLSAKDLDFQALRELSKNPVQAEGFWREVILSTAVSLLNENYLQDRDLGLVARATRTLSEVVNYLKERDFNITYRGFTLIKPKSMNWQERAIASKQFLQEISGTLSQETKVIITFDQLDTSFRHDLSSEDMAAYLRLLEALLSAAQSVHESNPYGGLLSVLPVVLIRSDILALISNNDKTKWEDDTVELVWSPGEIRQLLAHRIAADSGLDQSDFAANWHALFDKITLKDRYDNYTQKSSFEWMELRTTWCPRDYIYYIRECAEYAADQDDDMISFERLVYTEFNYSSYVRKQLLDEGRPHLKEIESRLEQISRLARDHSRKRNFSLDEFSEAFELDDAKTTAKILDALYSLNAIGNMTEGATGYMHNRYKFCFKDKFSGSLDKKGHIIIHPGLYRSLT